MSFIGKKRGEDVGRVVKVLRVEGGAPDLCLIFEGGPADPDYRDDHFQKELLSIEQALRAGGLQVHSRMSLQKADSGGSWLIGEFGVPLAALGTALVTLAGTWLTGKLGRKVRLKVGDIEAEAATVEQVEKLFERAREIKGESADKP